MYILLHCSWHPSPVNGKKSTVCVGLLTRNKIIPSEEVSVFHYINHLESDCKVKAILRAIQLKLKSERILLVLTCECISRGGTVLGVEKTSPGFYFLALESIMQQVCGLCSVGWKVPNSNGPCVSGPSLTSTVPAVPLVFCPSNKKNLH